jgi:hypothetical protein
MKHKQSEHDMLINRIGMQQAQLVDYAKWVDGLEDTIRLLKDDLQSLEIDYRDALDKIDHLELQLATAKDQLVLERNRSWQ